MTSLRISSKTVSLCQTWSEVAIYDLFTRGWNDLLGRETGPLHLRFVIQPLVATLFAIFAGLRDARQGAPVFFWTVVLDAQMRRTLLRQLWKDVGKLFLVACLLDVVYQLMVWGWVYPVQTILVATVLAMFPYLIFRGVANRLARRIGSKSVTQEGKR